MLDAQALDAQALDGQAGHRMRRSEEPGQEDHVPEPAQQGGDEQHPRGR